MDDEDDDHDDDDEDDDDIHDDGVLMTMMEMTTMMMFMMIVLTMMMMRILMMIALRGKLQPSWSQAESAEPSFGQFGAKWGPSSGVLSGGQDEGCEKYVNVALFFQCSNVLHSKSEQQGPWSWDDNVPPSKMDSSPVLRSWHKRHTRCTEVCQSVRDMLSCLRKLHNRMK